MECTVFRSDLSHPVTVREYYAELKTDHKIWQQMPRRMLRHKTLQQCARLAFGISAPELKLSTPPPISYKLAEANPKHFQANPKTLLRHKLHFNDL
jgi:hypothetical protein